MSKEVTFYNAFAYKSGDEWVIPLRYYVHQRRPMVESITTRLAKNRFELDEDEAKIFRSRVNDIVADSESREEVTFRFKFDPDRTTYFLTDENGERLRSDLNGRVEGELKLPDEKVQKLKEVQESTNGWLTYYATGSRHDGIGKIQFIEPGGVSVVSDIDDTVKVTEIPAGTRTVVENTFFKEFEAAPGMGEMYNEWEQVTAFHYVSGAPWQLYEPLSRFLFGETAGFPKGTFHMKNVRKNLFNLSSWGDLLELITNELVTFDQKVEQITELFEAFPDRSFIMVGDSGELDPEVYSEIRVRFPDQVKRIYIRDVVNARELSPERLEGMEIIEAETITPPAVGEG